MTWCVLSQALLEGVSRVTFFSDVGVFQVTIVRNEGPFALLFAQHSELLKGLRSETWSLWGKITHKANIIHRWRVLRQKEQSFS